MQPGQQFLDVTVRQAVPQVTADRDGDHLRGNRKPAPTEDEPDDATEPVSRPPRSTNATEPRGLPDANLAAHGGGRRSCAGWLSRLRQPGLNVIVPAAAGEHVRLAGTGGACGAEGEIEDGTPADGAIGLGLPAVSFDNAPDDGQPGADPGASVLVGAVELLKGWNSLPA